MPEEEKKFVSVGTLKPGNFILIDSNVCQIRSIEKSKPGKHGSAKARITAFDVFSGAKKNLLKPTSADAAIPIIKRSSATVVAVMGDIVQIMDVESYATIDAPNPKDISGLRSGVEVEYLRYGNNVKITRKKGA